MELNTSYWGTGTSYPNAAPMDFKWAGSGTLKNFASMWDSGNGVLKLNEHIDPSAYYCYSYASKLASYQYATIAFEGGDWTVKNVKKYDSPFCNYGFAYLGYEGSTAGNYFTSRLTSIRYRCVGYGIMSLSSESIMLTKYALARMRFVCYVDYCIIDSISQQGCITLQNPQEVTLKTFMEDSALMNAYENETLVIVGLKWVAYIKSSPDIVSGSLYGMVSPFTALDFEQHKDYTGDEYGYYLPSGSLQIVQGGYSAGMRISTSEQSATVCLTNTSDKWKVMPCRIANSSQGFAQPCLLSNKLEEAFHEFAYMGLYYTNNLTTAANSTYNDPDLYWGIMKFGKTSGKYKQGQAEWDNDEAIAAVATTNPTLINDIDPEEDPNPDYIGEDDPAKVDPNDYVIETPLTPPTLTTINVFNRSFAMTAIQLRALADWLWNADDDKMTEIIEGLALAGENPMNALIDCRLYPFDITKMINHTGWQTITIGRTSSDVGGIKLENAENAIIDLGECTFFEENKNFLDYSPHTQARLYLPYCGWHSIDPAEFMGKKITGKLVVDVVTGACNCVIYADGIILINATGVIGVEIPMTGTDSATFASQTLSASMQCISNIVQAGGMAMGGAGSISKGSSLMNSASATNVLSNTRANDYNLGQQYAKSGGEQISSGLGPVVDAVYAGWKAHTVPVQYEMAGAASPACANWLPQYAYFVIDRPVPLIPDGYGHTVGFACCETKPLSNYSGFTVITNADVSGFAQASEYERSELKALLEAGVFL